MALNQHVSQNLKTSQALTLNAQVHQALKILQVSSSELRQLAQEELNTNPLLEEVTEENKAPGTSATELDFGGSIDSVTPLPGDRYEHPSLSLEQNLDKQQYFFDSIPMTSSLIESLNSQAILFDMSPKEKEAFEFFVGSLDESGFWKGTLVDLANASALPVKAFQKAWQVLKELDPPGLGAKDLQECLLLQLRRDLQRNALAERLVSDYFQLLLHNKVKEMLDETEASKEALDEALAVIGGLNPAPGREFAEDTNTYIVPDIIVSRADEQTWKAVLSNEYIPQLRISQEYRQLSVSSDLNEQTRSYLKERMRSGRDFINAIKQRQETLGKIGDEIVRYQESFFNQGPSGLKPLTMAMVAEDLNVHETTVSRAIANKHLRCPFGIFPLKYFFSGGFTTETGEALASTAIKEKIADMVAAEDPEKPLSDADMVARLGTNGIKIARRTISKYREALNIPPAYLRKK